MKNIIIAILASLVLFGGGYMLYKPAKTAYGTTNVTLYTPFKSTGVLCGSNTSTLLVATSSSGRNLITISNASAQTVFLGMGVPAVAYQGTMLAASTTMTLNANGSYGGAIYCLGLGATASTSISDSQS